MRLQKLNNGAVAYFNFGERQVGGGDADAGYKGLIFNNKFKQPVLAGGVKFA